MLKQTTSVAIIIMFTLFNLSTVYGGQAIIMTDAELDMIHAGGLNFIDSIIGNYGAATTSGISGPVSVTLPSKPAPVVVSNSSKDFQLIQPEVPQSPAVQDGPTAPTPASLPVVVAAPTPAAQAAPVTPVAIPTPALPQIDPPSLPIEAGPSAPVVIPTAQIQPVGSPVSSTPPAVIQQVNAPSISPTTTQAPVIPIVPAGLPPVIAPNAPSVPQVIAPTAPIPTQVVAPNVSTPPTLPPVQPVAPVVNNFSAPASQSAPTPPVAPAPADRYTSSSGKFDVVAFEKIGSISELQSPTAPTAPDTLNQINISETSQQYLNSLVNVNAAGSSVLVQQNIIVNVNSTVNNIDINNIANLQAAQPLQ